MKLCRICGIERPESDFGPSGKAKRCRTCMRDYARDKAERIKQELSGELQEKKCWKCRHVLPIEQFAWKDPRDKGRSQQCLICADPDGLRRCPRCGETKPKEDFYRKSGGLSSYCKPCNKAVGREWTVGQYGLTPAEYAAAVAAQEGCCAICGQWTEVLWIDHDHSCCPGKNTCGRCRRGLLCMKCNGGLGMFGDDVKMLQKAIDYLQTYRVMERAS